ncbi:MAG TPA: BlaI/MecI/CopY family transcriptional regulator [Firmicutes bacterium]|nr:BlaI/MecI/CopY family transcriptional regulator [Bacillota bacterium]
MKKYRLTDMEAKFADIIWVHEPIPSGKLVRLCEAEFNWKKSTTYTMLKRLESKGIFKNNNGVVISLIKKDDFYAEQSKLFVEETFEGSLPKFIAAFTRSRKMSDKEIDELQRLIDKHREKER